MIAGMMVYALVVGALLALAAACTEKICRLLAIPVRWVWALALAAMVGLTALASTRVPPVQMTVAPTTTSESAQFVASDKATTLDRVFASGRELIARPVQSLLVMTSRFVHPSMTRVLAVLWLLSAVLVALVHLIAYRRVGRARRGWDRRAIDGVGVLVAPDAGPAVVGLARPEVVVPAWLLERSPEERQLVLTHEREHVRAGDPLLLAAGCAAAVLFPWHPAAWWMLARLRLAVETDCDRRVLRRGVPTRSYGTLLIDLAGHSVGLPAGAPALAGRPTQLERRLVAMTPRRTRHPLVRGGALGALVLAATIAACEAKLPTAAEVEAMDTKAVEKHVAPVLLTNGPTEYLVDGVAVTPEQARNLSPESIESVVVMKGTPREGVPEKEIPSKILIHTKDAKNPQRVALRAKVQAAESAGSIEAHLSENPLLRHAKAGIQPMFYIDGVKVDAQAVHRLSPNTIASVEVIKGPTALKVYGSGAEGGVISVTTLKSKQPKSP